jgi:Cdc6-like AAA superfamily ATPase
VYIQLQNIPVEHSELSARLRLFYKLLTQQLKREVDRVQLQECTADEDDMSRFIATQLQSVDTQLWIVLDDIQYLFYGLSETDQISMVKFLSCISRDPKSRCFVVVTGSTVGMWFMYLRDAAPGSLLGTAAVLQLPEVTEKAALDDLQVFSDLIWL